MPAVDKNWHQQQCCGSGCTSTDVKANKRQRHASMTTDDALLEGSESIGENKEKSMKE